MLIKSKCCDKMPLESSTLQIAALREISKEFQNQALSITVTLWQTTKMHNNKFSLFPLKQCQPFLSDLSLKKKSLYTRLFILLCFFPTKTMTNCEGKVNHVFFSCMIFTKASFFALGFCISKSPQYKPRLNDSRNSQWNVYSVGSPCKPWYRYVGLHTTFILYVCRCPCPHEWFSMNVTWKKATEEKMKISYHSSLSSYGKKAGMYQVSRKSKARISISISKVQT